LKLTKQRNNSFYFKQNHLYLQQTFHPDTSSLLREIKNILKTHLQNLRQLFFLKELATGTVEPQKGVFPTTNTIRPIFSPHIKLKDNNIQNNNKWFD